MLQQGVQRPAQHSRVLRDLVGPRSCILQVLFPQLAFRGPYRDPDSVLHRLGLQVCTAASCAAARPLVQCSDAAKAFLVFAAVAFEV